MKNTYSDVRIPTITNNSSLYVPLEISPEAQICLGCNLPAKKCCGLRCKRYKEKLKELKEKENER